MSTPSQATTRNENLNIRLGEELRAEVERVAAIGGVGVAEIIRLCVREALPVVDRAFVRMKAEFRTLHTGHATPAVATPPPAPAPTASAPPTVSRSSEGGRMPRRSRSRATSTQSASA